MQNLQLKVFQFKHIFLNYMDFQRQNNAFKPFVRLNINNKILNYNSAT